MADVADEPGLLMFLSSMEEVSAAVFDILCLTKCKLSLMGQTREGLVECESKEAVKIVVRVSPDGYVLS